jgi:hypothetical protein
MVDAEAFAALNMELVDHTVSTPLPPKIEGVLYGEVEVCVPAVGWTNDGGHQPSAIKVRTFPIPFVCVLFTGSIASVDCAPRFGSSGGVRMDTARYSGLSSPRIIFQLTDAMQATPSSSL